MPWTTFAPLSASQMGFVDANMATLAQMALIPCVMTGTSSITLTPALSGNGPPSVPYANYQAFVAIANATNTGSVAAHLVGQATLTVWKDTPAGPALLTGGEIVQLNTVVLIYDSLLPGGGFHLLTGGAYAPVPSAGPAVVSATSGVTLTAAQMTGSGTGQGVVVRSGAASGLTDTTDTAAHIIAAVPGGGSVVSASFNMRYVNLSSQTMTISGGTSVTLSGVATVAGPGSADFIGVVNGGTIVALYR